MIAAAWQLVENVSGDLVIGEWMIVVDDDRTAALMPGLYRDALTVTDALSPNLAGASKCARFPFRAAALQRRVWSGRRRIAPRGVPSARDVVATASARGSTARPDRRLRKIELDARDLKMSAQENRPSPSSSIYATGTIARNRTPSREYVRRAEPLFTRNQGKGNEAIFRVLNWLSRLSRNMSR
jgi:hypothetical protein